MFNPAATTTEQLLYQALFGLFWVPRRVFGQPRHWHRNTRVTRYQQCNAVRADVRWLEPMMLCDVLCFPKQEITKMGGGRGLVEGHTRRLPSRLQLTSCLELRVSSYCLKLTKQILCLNLTKCQWFFPKCNHVIVLFLWLHDSFLYGCYVWLLFSGEQHSWQFIWRCENQ